MMNKFRLDFLLKRTQTKPRKLSSNEFIHKNSRDNVMFIFSILNFRKLDHFMNGKRYRKKLLTINCIFIEILCNFETLTLPNKSPPQAPLGSGFCTDLPSLKMTKIIGRVGEDL